MHIYEELAGEHARHIRKREVGAMRKAGIRSHRGSGAPNSGLTAKEKLTQELEIPQAALRGVSHMELSGNREAIIEGCKGVVEYDEGIIRLNLGKNIVRFTGTGLSIRTLTLEQAIITGNILSIDFSN